MSSQEIHFTSNSRLVLGMGTDKSASVSAGDIDNDGDIDLVVANGRHWPQTNKVFINNGSGKFTVAKALDNIEETSYATELADIDNDGDKDISIVSNILPWQFGKTPTHYIFENDGLGNFTNVTQKFGLDFKESGNIRDIVWKDLNNDGLLDAIVAGYWMPIKVFLNDGKKLILQKNTQLEKTNGWWNSIKVADFDKDGDLDFIAGNWGLNTRLKASENEPITLYSNDFDDNGSVDPVITYYYQKQETPFASKDELVKQLPFLNKKYFPYGKKINFNSIRKGEIIGEHEVTFSSGKEIIKLNHEAFDRALYSDGALTAAKWLINKKPGLYSMRDLLNFK